MAVTEALRETLRRGLEQALATGPVETAAVLFGVAYVLLAIRQRRACWIAGGISTALYLAVFLEVRLYLQAALQILYVVLAVHGWREWGNQADSAAGLVVRRLGLRPHLLAVAATVAMTVVTAPAMAAWSDSAGPWADALGSWASVAATWLMIRKVAASWLWWIVVDAGLAVLFASQGLVFTALLYALFAVLAVAGWQAWRRAPGVAQLD